MQLHTSSSAHPPNLAALYGSDTYEWANINANLLRDKKYDQVDTLHLIEELMDMGKSQQSAILSHLRNLLMHLLKWQFQSEFRGRSWRTSIRNARIEIEDLIYKNPSLRSAPASDLDHAYHSARKLAADETDLPLQEFPVQCPFTLDQILDEDWLPL